MTQEELKQAWDASDTLVYRVLDDQGNNVADAQCRQYGDQWILWDVVDGYMLISPEQVQTLVLA